MNNRNVAFLWDESFLWGLMAYKALRRNGLPFDLIRARDIRNGALDRYQMLFVPGGWASNKSKALGSSGIEAIRRFVQSGGSYLGFCGGAGLGTRARGGIGLLDVQRKPTGGRVPSFSGRIGLRLNEHPIWEGLIQGSGVGRQGPGKGSGGAVSSLLTHDSGRIFHAWWPSQFAIEERAAVQVLAAYGDAMPDAFSSDLNVGDVEMSGGWDACERLYGINLDPARLKGEPAVIEGACGDGKVILSLVHFDTPDDENGHRVLINLWNYLAGQEMSRRSPEAPEKERKAGSGTQSAQLDGLVQMVRGLIALGERNFLWFRRNSMLLQWKRGVRGLEYNTLSVMVQEIAEMIHNKTNSADRAHYAPLLKSVEEKLQGFVKKAGNLLLLERLALQRGVMTYSQCDDPGIQSLRRQLFGDAKSHGGRFKEVLDAVDGILYEVLTH